MLTTERAQINPLSSDLNFLWTLRKQTAAPNSIEKTLYSAPTIKENTHSVSETEGLTDASVWVKYKRQFSLVWW